MSGNSVVYRRYAVLVTGHPPVSIQTQYGDYATLITNMLRNNDNEQWTAYRVVEQQFPSDEELKHIDAIILTGSKHDAHAELPWIQKTKHIIQAFANDQSKKVLGICFGHQLTAIALGGTSGRSQCGWEVGIRSLKLNSNFEKKFGKDLPLVSSCKILQIHRDQVLELPESAELLASSENTPVEMFSYGDNVLCLQGHPEFDESLVSELIVSRKESGVISTDVADAALDSLKEGTDNAELRSFLRSFIHRW